MIAKRATGFIRGFFCGLFGMRKPTEELSLGSAGGEGPIRAWLDQKGALVIGPIKTTHKFHYARINEAGHLSFFMSCREDSSVKLAELFPSERPSNPAPFDPSLRTKREGLLWAVEVITLGEGIDYRCAACNHNVTADLQTNAECCPKCGFSTKQGEAQVSAGDNLCN